MHATLPRYQREAPGALRRTLTGAKPLQSRMRTSLPALLIDGLLSPGGSLAAASPSRHPLSRCTWLRCCCCCSLFVKLVVDALNELAYPAELAGGVGVWKE